MHVSILKLVSSPVGIVSIIRCKRRARCPSKVLHRIIVFLQQPLSHCVPPSFRRKSCRKFIAGGVLFYHSCGTVGTLRCYELARQYLYSHFRLGVYSRQIRRWAWACRDMYSTLHLMANCQVEDAVQIFTSALPAPDLPA